MPTKRLTPLAMFAAVCIAAPLCAQTPAPTAGQPVSTPAQVQPTPTAPQTQPMPSPMPAQTPPVTSRTPDTTTQPPAAITSNTAADSPHGNALVLLEHIQKVLDTAVDGKPGQVSIDRGMLDEVRAELSQVRSSLKAEKR